MSLTRGTGSGQPKLWHASVAFYLYLYKGKIDQKQQKGYKKISKIFAARKIKKRRGEERRGEKVASSLSIYLSKNK